MKKSKYSGDVQGLGKRPDRFPLLVSYAYLRTIGDEMRDWILFKAKSQGYDVLLDSGAFSAANAGHVIPLDEYMRFLHEHGSSFFGYLLLDVLGDPIATRKNHELMIRDGLNPIPVHVLGDGQKRMDELFELSDFVALGGIRRPGRGPAPKSYVKKKMEWADGRPVHWLGYTNQDMVSALTPFSCDCSSWSYGDQYGWLQVYMGNGKWWLRNRADRKERFPISVMARLEELGVLDLYRLKDDDQWRSVGGRGSIQMECNVRSWVEYIGDLRKKIGTRLFLATVLIDGPTVALKSAWSDYKEATSVVND